MSSIFSLDHEIVQLPDTVGMLWVYQTSQRNWVTIKVHYRYLRKYLLFYADNLRVKSLFLDITSNIYNRAVTLSSDGELIRILSTDYRLNPQGALDINNYPGFQNILSQDISIQQIQVYTYNKTVPQNQQICHITDTAAGTGAR